MAILLQKPHLVKVTTKGKGGSKIPKILTTWFMDDPLLLRKLVIRKLLALTETKDCSTISLMRKGKQFIYTQ